MVNFTSTSLSIVDGQLVEIAYERPYLGERVVPPTSTLNFTTGDGTLEFMTISLFLSCQQW